MWGARKENEPHKSITLWALVYIVTWIECIMHIIWQWKCCSTVRERERVSVSLCVCVHTCKQQQTNRQPLLHHINSISERHSRAPRWSASPQGPCHASSNYARSYPILQPSACHAKLQPPPLEEWRKTGGRRTKHLQVEESLHIYKLWNVTKSLLFTEFRNSCFVKFRHQGIAETLPEALCFRWVHRC